MRKESEKNVKTGRFSIWRFPISAFYFLQK